MAYSKRFQEAVELLVTARTSEQVSQAGRILESLPIAETESFAVQERLVKVLALSGLLSPALQLTDTMLDSGYVPSLISQDAICNTLRRNKKLTRLEQLIHRIGQVAAAKNNVATNATIANSTVRVPQNSLSVPSFNIYLAALCDAVASNDAIGRSRRSKTRGELLETARQWLQPDFAPTRLGVAPDAISFATVLHAVASASNQVAFDSVWNDMIEQGIAPSVTAYNARLRCTLGNNNNNKNNNNNEEEAKQGDEQAVQLWREIRQDSRLQLDRYTVDLILLPLIRAGKIGQVEAILDKFVSSNSDTVVSNAFAAFLLTIIKKGEVSTARALFDIYILPALEPVVTGDAVSRLVRPTARHFNALLDGYRRTASSLGSNSTEINVDIDTEDSVPENDYTKEGWNLYSIMAQSQVVQPDSYTITSMMGLCQTPVELSDLLGQAVYEFGIECSSVVLRAAITAYGELGDASSACWVFAKHLSFCRGTREWNVLAGALAKGATDDSSSLDISSADVARTLSGDWDFDASQQAFVDALSGLTCVDAVKTLLNLMCGHQDGDILSVPSADSQTYCIAASALQYGPASADQAVAVFRNATVAGIPADGRFINAVLRCFGDDITAALSAWKQEIRPACLTFENRARNKSPSMYRPKGKNLLAAYNGLLFVCGRALRPDIAVRIVYAMNKEGLEPDELSQNCYRSGKRAHQSLLLADKKQTSRFGLRQKLNLIDVYESLLYVECTKYDRNDKRRAGERRVRIIV